MFVKHLANVQKNEQLYKPNVWSQTFEKRLTNIWQMFSLTNVWQTFDKRFANIWQMFGKRLAQTFGKHLTLFKYLTQMFAKHLPNVCQMFAKCFWANVWYQMFGKCLSNIWQMFGFIKNICQMFVPNVCQTFDIKRLPNVCQTFGKCLYPNVLCKCLTNVWQMFSKHFKAQMFDKPLAQFAV